MTATSVQPEVISSNREYPGSASQQRLWFLHRLDVGSPVYNLPRVWRVAGPLNIDALAGAIARLIARHEPLRTNFALKGGNLVQIVAPPPVSDLSLVDLAGHSDAELELPRIVDEQVSRPFDLERDLMLRTCLVRIRPNDHVLILVTHHIASDRWSSLILHQELGRLYEALSAGSPCDLTALPIRYGDYAEQEQKYLKSPQAQRALAYWTSHLAGTPLLLHLPTDRPRPAFQAHRGALHCFSISEELLNELRKLSQRERITLSTLLLAAFQTLLFRSCQQASFVIGVPVTNRSQAALEGLIGNFVNTLPIRTHIRDGQTFTSLLKDTGRAMLGGLDHQVVPVESVIESLAPARNLSYSPLFQVLFNFTNNMEEQFQVAGLGITPLSAHNRASLEDLTLYLTADGGRLRGAFEYDVDLFNEATIARFSNRFLTLLESIIRDPNVPVSRLEWIPLGEQATMSEWNATTISFRRDSGIHRLIEEQSRQKPDAIAVVCNEQSLTYRQLEERANSAANFLANLGAGPGSRIAIAMERSVDMVVGLLAILKTGAAYVPLDLAQPPSRLQTMVDDSDAEILLTHTGATGVIRTSRAAPVRLETAIQQGRGDPPLLGASAATPAYLIYTSGTTGKPKGVVVSHRAVINVLESMSHRPGLTEADTLLAITPLSFDIAGLEIFLPLLVGARLEIADRQTASDPASLARKLIASRATVMQATPSTWRMLIESGWQGCGRLSAWCGGEALTRELADRLMERVGSLWNLYGPTETTIWSAISRVERGGGPPPIGTPIANTKLHVLDSNLQLVPIGVAGQLYISGAGLADGYWKQPELTEGRFPANPFEPGTRMYHTGDRVRWLANGTLEYLGRDDSQVKIRGFRIELGEIEAALARHPEVGHSVVVARDGAPGDKLLIAYVEPRQGSTLDSRDLREYLKQNLADPMLPSAFVCLDKLPLTPNGKVDRKALPPPEPWRIKSGHDSGPPRDPLEQMLAGAWAKVLKVKQVGRRDNFFELGGHSLAAVQLLVEVQKLTGKTLPLATLFQASTVEAFADLLRKDGPSPSWSSLVPIHPLGSKRPLFLIHGAEGNVLLYRQLAQHLGSDQPVYGLQSRGLNGEGRFDETLQDMACNYVRELMTVQPHGPYFLAGYCLGGLIAYEMAQQLTALGEKVAYVVMLDTYNTGRISAIRRLLRFPLYLIQNAWFHCANAFCVRAKERRAFLLEKMDIALRRLDIRLQAVYHAFRRVAKQEARNQYPHLTLKRINDRAAFQYVPKPYANRVAVVRSRAYFWGRTSPSLGWDSVVPDSLEIRELPVYPKGMLSEPFCQSLAETLTAYLQNA